ncbi:hypothetical protein [Methyloprofundus sp.]|uniref:hypothetical protein n=1 Tax=Methyloprofundus sp. TaxID=2020875 RepID=UPI003D0E6BC2
MKEKSQNLGINNIYSTEKLELFRKLEDDVENGIYTPISKERLDERKRSTKHVLALFRRI